MSNEIMPQSLAGEGIISAADGLVAAIDDAVSTVDGLVSAAIDDSVAAIGGSVSVIGESVDQVSKLQSKIKPMLKRVIDLSAAFLLLLLVLPLACLIVAAFVLNGDKPFVSSVRIGRGGREFNSLKFRTTPADANDLPAQHGGTATLVGNTHTRLGQYAIATRFGQVLKDTGLDELPQLINILVGDMSFSGPRPLTPDELRKFNSLSKAAMYSAVRPGLLGR